MSNQTAIETDDVVVTVTVQRPGVDGTGDTGPPPAPAPMSASPIQPRVAFLAVAVVALISGMLGYAVGAESAGQSSGGVDVTVEVEPAPEPTVVSNPTVEPTAVAEATPPDPNALPCPPDAERCIEIDSITRDGDSLTVEWTAIGFTPAINGFHAHFFWDVYEPVQVGASAAGADELPLGEWVVTAEMPYETSLSGQSIGDAPRGTTAICVTVGNSRFELDDPELFQCADIPPA